MKEIACICVGAIAAGALMYFYGSKTIAEIGKMKTDLIDEFNKAVAAIKKDV